MAGSPKRATQNHPRLRMIRNMKTPVDWNIPEIVAAVIADNPDAASIADSLAKSLQQLKDGQRTPAHQKPLGCNTHKQCLKSKTR